MPWQLEPPPKIGAVVDLDVYGRHYECSISQFADPLVHLEVWTETRGMAGSMRPVVERYGIGVTAAGGTPSASLIYEASQRIMASAGCDNPVILYIGDADKHGWHIQSFIEADFLETHAVPILLRRVAISHEEAQERGDPNAEVISVGEMRERLETAIRDQLGDASERRDAAIEKHYDDHTRYSLALRDDHELRVHLDAARERLREMTE